jgi:hypothetical protein
MGSARTSEAPNASFSREGVPMFRSNLRFRQLVSLTAMVGLMIPAAAALGEVHAFCPILAATQCRMLQARSAGLVDQIARQAGNNPAAQQAINAVRNRVSKSTLNGADLVNLARAMRAAGPPKGQAKINVAIGQIAVNQQVQLWLLKGQPRAAAVPSGSNVPIALVPGVPRGRIVPMGFGPVIIGVDQASDAIVLGEGNVEQVAAEVSAPSTANVEVTLANAASATVNYTVNQQTYSMAPTFEQNLTGGSSWVVQFDRGEGNGTAQYKLSQGYYEFTVTPKGWELYRKQKPSMTTVSQQSAQTSDYAEAAGISLPQHFKMFDPVPVLTGSSQEKAAAQLPEHFSLFRAAAEKVAQTETPRS